MGNRAPEYSLEEILSVLARNIIKSGNYYEEDYKLLSAVENDFYILKENNNE